MAYGGTHIAIFIYKKTHFEYIDTAEAWLGTIEIHVDYVLKRAYVNSKKYKSKNFGFIRSTHAIPFCFCFRFSIHSRFVCRCGFWFAIARTSKAQKVMCFWHFINTNLFFGCLRKLRAMGRTKQCSQFTILFSGSGVFWTFSNQNAVQSFDFWYHDGRFRMFFFSKQIQNYWVSVWVFEQMNSLRDSCKIQLKRNSTNRCDHGKDSKHMQSLLSLALLRCCCGWQSFANTAIVTQL